MPFASGLHVPHLENEMKKSVMALSILAFTAGTATQITVPVLAGPTEDVQAAMQLLKSKTAEFGAPTIQGEDKVADKVVPGLYFGNTEIDNNFTLVDEVQQKMGGTATLFVKSGNDFVRVATNVKKDDGSRAIGTVLDPKGKAMAAIAKNESYFGEATILGKPYITGYEPIHDANNNIIGVYYVGYPKSQ
jgi:Cache 3/Cache 2 fusion domain